MHYAYLDIYICVYVLVCVHVFVCLPSYSMRIGTYACVYVVGLYAVCTYVHMYTYVKTSILFMKMRMYMTCALAFLESEAPKAILYHINFRMVL